MSVCWMSLSRCTCILLWPPCIADMDITFLPCDFFFLSSPNLSRRRLDIYHTSTQNTGRKKSPSEHHRTTLSGYILTTKAHIDNRKNLLCSNNSTRCPPQYGEHRPTSGWDRSGSLGHPSKFQRVSILGSVTVRYSSSGRQQKFATLNKRRHLYSAGWPSRWASAHILVLFVESKLIVYAFDKHNLLCLIICR